jgi:hypothetical protein
LGYPVIAAERSSLRRLTLLPVAGSSRWNCGLEVLDGGFKKLNVGDPRDVVNKPMMRTRMKMPDMVAVKRIRGGVTGILLHTLLIHTYFAVSRERERERERESVCTFTNRTVCTWRWSCHHLRCRDLQSLHLE